LNNTRFFQTTAGRSFAVPDIRAVTRILLLIALLVTLGVSSATAADIAHASDELIMTPPAVAHVGVYIVDFKRFSVGEGTVEAMFYLNIRSDTNVSISDLEFMNGRVSSVDVIRNTPTEKNYRIYAVMAVDPDLRYFPFDSHNLPIILEPKTLNEDQLSLVIDPGETGLDEEADIPGWTFTSSNSTVTNRSYTAGEIPYSRAVFSNGISRDSTSTILKFFLPISLIIIVSLASLMMKVSSRLGLNASMFLAAVLIHWRVADAIPLVAYATFLDIFMIITYATLVMVLVSGIMILKYNESKDTARAEQISWWSLRIIPVVSLTMYFLLFLWIMV
jgi:hypothetical protein